MLTKYRKYCHWPPLSLKNVTRTSYTNGWNEAWQFIKHHKEGPIPSEMRPLSSLRVARVTYKISRKYPSLNKTLEYFSTLSKCDIFPSASSSKVEQEETVTGTCIFQNEHGNARVLCKYLLFSLFYFERLPCLGWSLSRITLIENLIADVPQGRIRRLIDSEFFEVFVITWIIAISKTACKLVNKLSLSRCYKT